MSHCIDTKFSFLNGHYGPGARKGHHITAPTHQALERSRSDPSLTLGERATLGQGAVRAGSIPGMGIPAGYSQILGNRLGLSAYANLNGRYVARLDVPPPARAPRPVPASRQGRLEETWVAPERMKPETLPPAGGIVARIRGKRIVEDNTNYMSNADTLIFGRDLDGSMGCRAQGHTVTYAGSAGLNAKFEREPAWGTEPPTCLRTFGEDAAANDFEHQVSYERHDPRQFEGNMT